MLALLAAAGLGAYIWYRKTHFSESGRPLGITSADVRDPQTGFIFHSQLVDTFKDDTAKYDIFLAPLGTRVLTYLQTGADKNSRVELIHPDGVDPNVRASALRVFGVRPKAS